MAVRYRKDGKWENYPGLQVRSGGSWESLRYLLGSVGTITVEPDDPRYPWEPGDPSDPGPREINNWIVVKAFEAPNIQPPTPMLHVDAAPGWENKGDEDEAGNPRPADTVSLSLIDPTPEGIIPQSWRRYVIFNLNGREIAEEVPSHSLDTWTYGTWDHEDGLLSFRVQFVNEVGGGPLSASSATLRVYGPPELR